MIAFALKSALICFLLPCELCELPLAQGVARQIFCWTLHPVPNAVRLFETVGFAAPRRTRAVEFVFAHAQCVLWMCFVNKLGAGIKSSPERGGARRAEGSVARGTTHWFDWKARRPLRHALRRATSPVRGGFSPRPATFSPSRALHRASLRVLARLRASLRSGRPCYRNHSVCRRR